MSSTPVESTSQALPARKGLPLFAKIVLGFVGVILFLILVMFGVGMATPVDHEVAKYVLLKARPEAVYDVIVDWEHYPEWRPEVKSVNAVPDPEGDPRWSEDWGSDPMELEITVQEPGRRVEMTFHDPSGQFSGRWEYLIAPADDSVLVHMTQRGSIPNPMMRGAMTLIPGAKTMCLTQYLTGLAGKFGADPSRIK